MLAPRSPSPHLTALCFALPIAVALALPCVAGAGPPTIARLCLWTAPERVAELDLAYGEVIASVLARHGLVAAEHPGRKTVPGVVHRLFELEKPADIARLGAALADDPEWQRTLRDLGDRFGVAGTPLRHAWGPYSSPLGPGITRPAGEGRGVWRTVPDDYVRDMAQDRDGSLWLTTNGLGARRYDGREVDFLDIRHGVAHLIVRSVLVDTAGDLWLGTFDGVSRCRDGACESFTTDDGLAANPIFAGFEDDGGRLWFGTEGGGVSRYDGQQWTSYDTSDGLAGNLVRAIGQDEQGRMWFGTDRGASRYDGVTWRTFTIRDGLPGDDVRAILTDAEGRLWLGTDRGACRHDDGRWVSLAVPHRPGSERIRALFEDADGSLWVGTYGAGVNRYDGETWRTFTKADGLVDDHVLSILQDREGDLWFGTEDGASWYGGETVTRFGVEDGLPHHQMFAAVVDRQGDLWVGTNGGGIGRYDGDSWTTWTVADGLPEDYMQGMIVDRQGDLWFLSGGIGAEEGMFQLGGRGISRYDGTTLTTYTVADGLPSDWLAGAMEDEDGRLLFAVGGRLARLDSTRFTSVEGLELHPYDGDGDFRELSWSGSFSGALHFDGRRLLFLGRQHGLPSDWVFSTMMDRDGVLWVTTGGVEGGVSRYDDDGWTTFGVDDGVAGTYVYAVSQDRAGEMWFATGGGVTRFDGRVMQNLTTGDGLSHGNIQFVLEDRRGDFWFPSGLNGLTRYRQPPTAPPTVSIEAVVADRRYAPSEMVAFPSTASLVALEYSGTSLKTRPDGLVYRYRLRGLDEQWHTTRERRVELSDVPSGDYVFQVQAVDRDMGYSELTSLGVQVHPPYDRIGLGTALAVALGLVAWLTRRVVRRGREIRRSNEALSGANSQLERRSVDLEQANSELDQARVTAESANHAKSLFLANMSHEIRTPMNAILGYAQILQRSGDLDDRHRRAIETIHRSGDHLLDLINDVLDISKIEAGRMELVAADFDLAEMVKGLSVMFDLQCREKGIGWQLDMADEAPIPVHADEAKLRQVLINLIGNAVKFTPEGHVMLSVRSAGTGRFRFEVQDTGAGMGPDEVEDLFRPFQQGEAGRRTGGTGLGLTISQRQLDLMQSRLEVKSAPGQGSVFSFTVSLPAATATLKGGPSATLESVSGLAPEHQVRVLIADDVAENREILASMLADVGCEVHTVENGQEALDQLDVSEPDIVFLDIRMPILDGLETLRRLRADGRWTALKVAAISASVLDHERRSYLEAGFDDFLDKPFRFESICACLERHLGVTFMSRKVEEAAPAGDWGELELPADLSARLKRAAEFYSVTQIESLLAEIESLGPMHGRLAAHLRALRQQHDMEGIVTVLEAVRNG